MLFWNKLNASPKTPVPNNSRDAGSGTDALAAHGVKASWKSTPSSAMHLCRSRPLCRVQATGREPGCNFARRILKVPNVWGRHPRRNRSALPLKLPLRLHPAPPQWRGAGDSGVPFPDLHRTESPEFLRVQNNAASLVRTKQAVCQPKKPGAQQKQGRGFRGCAELR